MIGIKLKKLLAKPKLHSLIKSLLTALDSPVLIKDVEGNILLGKAFNGAVEQYPIAIEQEIIGWVEGDRKIATIADILTFAALQELEKKNLAAETLNKYEELNFLYDISSKISTCLSIQEVIEVVIDEVKKLINITKISFMLINPQTSELEIIQLQQNQLQKTAGTISGVEGQVMRSGKAEIVNNFSQDPRFLDELNAISSLICAPLTVHNQTIGVITISHTEAIDYTTEDLKLFSALTSQAATAIQTTQYYEQLKEYSRTLEIKVAERTQELAETNEKLQIANQELERLATTDDLTRVYNRRYFNDYLLQEWRRLMRERHPISLILCDVDYFKLYNDHYGHPQGDDCLQKVAGAMAKLVKRPADLVARYGGEEFVIILSNTNGLGGAQVAEDIRLAVLNLGIFHPLSKVHQFVTLSAGIATTIPTPELSPETLINMADKALYEAKETGRNRYCLKAVHPKIL